MNNIWHWQQYFTLWCAIIGAVFQVLAGLVAHSKAGTAALMLILLAFGQFVLYSGGWYGTF